MKTSTKPLVLKTSRIPGVSALALTAVVTAALFTAKAADFQWQGGTASYTNAANWNPATVPGSLDNAINNNGTNNKVQINAGNPDWSVNQLQTDTGAFEQNGQTVTLFGTNVSAPNYHSSVRLGKSDGSTGVLIMNGGTLNYTNALFNIGELGTGIMTMNGGVVTGSGYMGVNSGFNPVPTAVNATFGGVDMSDYTWFEQGYYAGNASLGIPAPNTPFVSASQSDHTFKMAPSYTANDAVFLSANVTTATVTPTSPSVCYGLSFMGSAGHGPVVVNYTIHFADTTTQAGSISVLDWFPPADLGASTNVMVVGGRVNALGINFQTPSGNPQLLSTDVAVTNNSSVISSIDLSYVSGGVACIMAVSSQTAMNGSFDPMNFTGYNKDIVVEASYNNMVSSSVTSELTQTGGNIDIVGGGQFFVGNYGKGVYNLSGGTNTVHNYVAFGRSSGTGTVNMTGGVFNQAGGGNLLVGTGYQNVNGTPAVGVLNQSGGTINSIGQVLIPENSPSMGTYNLSGPGSLNVSNWFVVGRQGGSGVMTISNNATINKTSNGDFIVCDGDGNYSGTVIMDSGTFNVSSGAFRVGNGNDVQASFTQNGGTVNVANNALLLPDHGNGTTLGTYSMSGSASLTVNGWLAVGRGGAPGILNLTNGSITKLGNSGNHFDIGASGIGTLNQYGGAITNTTSDFWLGESADATWNMNGGTALLSVLRIGQGSGLSATMNINGGDLTVQEITGNPNSGTYLYLDGATIRATADNANFLHGLTAGAFVSAGGVTFDSQGYNIGVAQALYDYGGGGLAKDGAGTLTLSGANSYTGPTVVNAGGLATTTDSTGSGSYSIADGTTLSVAVKQYLGATLYVSSLTLANSTAATLNIDLGAFGNPTTAPITDFGDLTANGTITINVADSLPNYGQFPLIQYSGTLGGAGHFELGSLPFAVGAYLSNNIANNSIDLVVTNVNLPRWEGLAGGDWDIGLTTNWVNVGDGMPTYYAEGNKVLFDDNAAGTTTVNLADTVSPNGVTVDNSILPYAFTGSGKISGAFGLTKKGSGTLVITNSGGNDYTGATVISGGELDVQTLADGGVPSPIGASTSDPANLVFDGGTLNYSGPATTINRGYLVQGGGAIDVANSLTLSGMVSATGTNGFTKTGAGQLAYTTTGSNLLSAAGSSGYVVQSGTVVFDGSNGGQTNSIQGAGLGVNDPAGNALVVLTNTTVTLGSDMNLGSVANTTGSMVVNSNATLNVGSYFIFGDGGGSLGSGYASGTFTLNGGTVNVPNGQIVMGGNIGAYSTMNINGGVFNALGGNFNIANAGWNNAGVRTGVVNQVSGTVNINGETWIGQAADGHGFYNLHGGTINAQNWFVVGRNGSVGNMIMDGGIINKTGNGDFLVGDGGGTVGTMNMTNAIINLTDSTFTVGHAGATGTMNQNGGSINITNGEYWVAENGSATNNISGAAVINVSSYVTIARGGSTGVVNMSGGTFTQTGVNPFFIGIFGGAHGIWNQSGGDLSIPNRLHIGDGCTGELTLSGGSIYANSEVWIGQGGSGIGTMTISGGAFTNNFWLAIGREGAQGVLNISGGIMVKQGDGNISITHNSGATGTVNQSGGTFICASGETWIGENGGPGTWNMDGGTSIFGVVHLAQNADAQGVLNLNGGSLTATEISTGNNGASQRELNLNGGTIVAGADNASFIHDLSAANVLTNGVVFDTASHTVGVNQDLLGGTDDGGLTKMGAGTLYLNGANTYTNATMVNAGALGGSGTIMGTVTVAAGARLSPGTASIGTLTINNSLNLDASSSTLAKVSMAGGGSNDMVNVSSVVYGGTLVVTNAGGSPLVPGTQFQLFSAASHSGNYVNAASVSILPAGAGTFDPATGKLTITSSGVVSFNPVTVSGGNLILTGDGGAAPGSGYTLLTSTNVATPLSLWTTNTTGVLDGSGMFSNSIPLNSLDAARFFDVRVP